MGLGNGGVLELRAGLEKAGWLAGSIWIMTGVDDNEVFMNRKYLAVELYCKKLHDRMCCV